MHLLSDTFKVCLILVVLVALVSCGCSRTQYRLQADQDAYGVIAERNQDPRWYTANPSVEIDPRSRYFDPYPADCSPLPPDDPAAHQYMHRVNGMRGWQHWHANGERAGLENPGWQERLADYVEVNQDGEVKLDVDSALRLAYVHSPNHQRQLETLYLSALDVTAERFRLGTQFFGGYDYIYNHRGSLVPAALVFDPVAGRYVITPPFHGAETNRLTLGRPSAANPALFAQRRFATAGELLVGFANSFVFEFTGPNVSLASSLANFSFIQPVLRGGGRDVALEQLTFTERNLLANLRSYAQFRQGFYTQVAIGESGVTGPQRFGQDTNLLSFSGQAGFSGYLGLLQQFQQIRNSEDNLRLQLRTLERLEALLDNDLIDLVQVDQFRQNVENERADLLFRRNALALSLDRYKTATLGLPPDLSIEVDDGLIQQFQLVPREVIAIQDSIVALQDQVAGFPVEPEVVAIDQALDEAFQIFEPVRQLFVTVREDLDRMEAVAPSREEGMSDEDKELFQSDRDQLFSRLLDLEQEFDSVASELGALGAGLSEPSRADTARKLVAWVAKFLQLVERLVLVPARARLEAITIDSIELESKEAFQIALENRLDFMNGRAALVDTWRLIQVNADALQSVLNVTASGDLRTARNNPASFRAPTGSARLGFEFDAPFTRLLERNAYRQSLIEYQRSRRDFIQSRDSLHLGLRELLRRLEQLRQSLEIQRRAVTIAIRQVDQTQLSLNPPRAAPQPGTRPPINPTTAINLLSAQTSLRNSQNNFLNVWLNYYATRLRLYRELGVMALDPDGRWIDRSLGDSVADGAETGDEQIPLPPMVPAEWIEAANYLQLPTGLPENMVRGAGYSSSPAAAHIERLPPAG